VRRFFFNAILCLAATYPCVAAGQVDRTYCEVSGYFAGEGDNFLSSLAQRALAREGLSSDPQCTSVWKGAVEIGKRVSAGNTQFSRADLETADKAIAFRRRVQDFILQGAGILRAH
jgi:small ligand-binding sensory domain FIST